MTIKVAFIMDTTVSNIKKRWADAVQQTKVTLLVGERHGSGLYYTNIEK
jgi:hypothetical protein